jgi:hypothetical protein
MGLPWLYMSYIPLGNWCAPTSSDINYWDENLGRLMKMVDTTNQSDQTETSSEPKCIHNLDSRFAHLHGLFLNPTCASNIPVLVLSPGKQTRQCNIHYLFR